MQMPNILRQKIVPRLGSLSAYLQPVQVRPLDLEFELTLNPEGRHVVRVYMLQGHKRPVQDVPSLWSYGYNLVITDEDGSTTYLLRDEDRQTLYALRSLEPTTGKQGELICQIDPPTLKYLRSRKNLRESSQAQQVLILEEPLRPTARVDYTPQNGLSVQAGYWLPGGKDLLGPQELQTSRDGRYVQMGSWFLPLPTLSEAAQQLLAKPKQFIPDPEVPEFVQHDLASIRKEFNAILSELAQRIRVVNTPLLPLVEVEKESGWLNFTLGYQAAGKTLPHARLLPQKDAAYFKMDTCTWLKMDRALIERVDAALKDLEASPTEKGYRLPLSEFAALEEFIEAIGGSAQLSQAYQQFLGQLTGFEANEAYPLSPRLEEQLKQQGFALRPYQRAGIHWLDWLRQNDLHGVLADDMGLGKTLQSLCALRLGYEQTHSKQHSLIVAPKSVLHQWVRELGQCYPEMPVEIYHGAQRQPDVFQYSHPTVFVTTYETIGRDVEVLAGVTFFYLILDEATRIKNPDTQRTQAIKALNAMHRLALSGTPVENRPAELWSLFDFLMRGHLGKYGSFVRHYEEQIIAGDEHAVRNLGRRIRPFLLRRKKDEVAKDLPEKVLIEEWCELSSEQRQLYNGLEAQAKRLREALRRGETINYTANILPVLTQLKQICDHPALTTRKNIPLYGRSEKFDWIIAKAEEIVQNGEQVIIFSHFLNMLGMMESALREKGIAYVRIDGSTENRQEQLAKFEKGEAKVALLSLMAAGYGINMKAANHVIHADRWWNPAVEDQATDRVHRIGQQRTVFVYHILVEGTLEERINALLASKRGVADQVIGAANEGPRRWSREELMELLHPLG